MINSTNKFKERDIVKIIDSLYPFVVGIISDYIQCTEHYVVETYDKEEYLCFKEDKLVKATNEDIDTYNNVFLHGLGFHLDANSLEFIYWFNKYDLVLVPDSGGKMNLAYFDFYDKDINEYVITNGDRYKICLPYFKNTKLLGKI